MSKQKLRDNLNQARTLKRPKLHSSRLLHVLADLSLADTAGSSVAFAEKLALWVDFTHAIKLSGLLNTHAAAAAIAPKRSSGGSESLVQTLNKVRNSLENLITQGCSPKVFKAQVELHSPSLELSDAPPTTYEPYRRYYMSLQRDMETSVHALHLRVREALVKASPNLKKLVALDTTFEGILAEREGKWLAKMPVMLEKQFGTLLAQNTSTETNDWLKPGHWLHQFSQNFQTLLLAELDLRLQSTLGLVEAYQGEFQTQT